MKSAVEALKLPGADVGFGPERQTPKRLDKEHIDLTD